MSAAARRALAAALSLALLACADRAPSPPVAPHQPGGGEQAPREVTQVDILAASDEPLLVAGSRQLQARLRAVDGTALDDHPVAWESSDPSVVGVTPQGVVFGVAAGEAVVSATAGRGRAERRVVVAPIAVAALQLSRTELTLAAGEDAALGVVTLAADGRVLTDRAVAWRSTADDVLAVNASGQLRGVRPGRAQVVVESEGVRATATVTVADGVVGAAPSRWTLRVTELAGAGVRCTLDGIAFRIEQAGHRVDGEFLPGARVSCAPVPGAQPPFATPLPPHGAIEGTIAGREVRLYAMRARWTFVGTLSADGRTLEGAAMHVGEVTVTDRGSSIAPLYQGRFAAAR